MATPGLHTSRRTAWLIQPSRDATPSTNEPMAWEKHSSPPKFLFHLFLTCLFCPGKEGDAAGLESPRFFVLRGGGGGVSQGKYCDAAEWKLN